MKVLLVTMTVGEGHNSIAKAIKNSLEKKGVETRLIEQYGYDPDYVARDNRRYLWACKYIPHLYNFVWNRLNKIDYEKRYSNFLQGSIKKCTVFLTDHIKDFGPDAIVCSSHYAAAALCNLKREGKLPENIKVYSILFDYCLCPYWESSILVDKIFTPADFVDEVLIERGFKKEQIVYTGFPVQDKFNNTLTSLQAKEILNIDEKKFTILILNGGNGLGNTLKLLKYLQKVSYPIQILCVNGKNKKRELKIEKYIKKHGITNIYNYGFVTNVEVFMRASDVIFSRGGGVTITEATDSILPIICREKAINNEKINKEIFIEKGMALGLNKLSESYKKVNYLIENPQKLEEMKKNIEKFRKPNATSEITDYVINAYKNSKTNEKNKEK